MTRGPRPLSVTLLACIYLAVGTVGLAYHFPDVWAKDAFQFDGIGVELVRLLAIVCGVFLLTGRNWARWTALAWIVFHVILSAFHNLREFAVHGVICVLIFWVLLRPAAARYFRGAVDAT